jgi:hypothetical protein
MPICVMIGIHALPSACFLTTVFSGTPFALAVRMKSALKTSSMLDRVCLVAIANKVEPCVTAGSIMLRMPWSKPTAGSQPSICENRSMSISPSQKFGIDIPMIENAVTMVSGSLPARFDANMPIGIPIAAAKAIDATASIKVFGSRDMNVFHTLILVTSDTPKSPCMRFTIYSPYLYIMGM